MYKKTVSKKELAKIKKEQENLDLYNAVKNKVFICKKDIACEKGTFMRGSPVFLDDDGGACIGHLYDLTQWNSFDLNYKYCFSDYCLKRISVKMLPEYFEYSHDLTLAYQERLRMANELEKKQHIYHNSYYKWDSETLGWGIAAAVLLTVMFLMAKAVIVSIVIATISASLIGRFFYCANKCADAENEYEEFIKTAKEDMRELAYRGESRAVCYQLYANEKIREKTIAETKTENVKVNLLKDSSISEAEITMDALRKAAEYEYSYTE